MVMLITDVIKSTGRLLLVGMGWSWSVYLAQAALMGVGEKTGEILMKRYDIPENPITMANALVEGGPPPTPKMEHPYHYEYIDDYGFIQFAPEKMINQERMTDFRDSNWGPMITSPNPLTFKNCGCGCEIRYNVQPKVQSIIP